MPNFEKLVKYHWEYLVTDYQFLIIIASDHEVVFESNQCIVQIFAERWQIYVDFKEPNKFGTFDLGTLINLINPEANFKYNYCDKEQDIEAEIKRLAKFTKLYCVNILQGDFMMRRKYDEYVESQWKKFEK